MSNAKTLEALFSDIVSLRNDTELPDEDYISDLTSSTISVLKSESDSYRPRSSDDKAGGLLDFSKFHGDVIVVPDIHARPDFLINLLLSDFTGHRILESLADGSVKVVCVGDGVHTETAGRCYKRWMAAYKKWLDGSYDSSYMRGEMHDCFATMFAVMKLKIAFPESFHFLKGNHENVKNENENGNWAFRKFAKEGDMVRDFILEYYSEKTLDVLSDFEYALPVAAIFSNFGISHAEPMMAYTREQVIDYHAYDDLILGLTWTNNDEACENSARDFFHQLNPKADAEKAFWIGGHRPVPEKYRLLQDGAYIQIHNPYEMNVAWIHADGSFTPESDMISVIPDRKSKRKLLG